jgi:hypothetical protein
MSSADAANAQNKPKVSSEPKSDFDALVSFDRENYQLSLTGARLQFKNENSSYRLLRRKCNQGVFDRIALGYLRQMAYPRKTHASESRTIQSTNNGTKNSHETEYNVSIAEVGQPLLYITRGSASGSWLRDLPHKIMFLVAEAEVACRTK